MSHRRPEQLSIHQARRIALAAQGLNVPSRNGTANWTRINGAVARMNVLQIDSVNVLVRSHYLPVFSRVGSYEQDTLDSRTSSRRKRRFFEYWAHQASFVPLEYYPLLRWRMERARAGAGTYGALARFATEQKAYVDEVLAHVRKNGPVTVADLPDPGERTGNWWGWGKGKYALEYLFDTGEVTAATRRGFERLYDIPERVIPPDILNRPAPSEHDAIRSLTELSIRALGIGTKADIADYFRLLIAQVSPAIAEMVAEGTLSQVMVEGWDQPAYIHKDAAVPRRSAAQALVTPFDPIVWDRARTERLFDFRYRIEIYTPEPKRIYGYYVLPFVLGDRIAARICLKADRPASVLRANAAHLETGADLGETAEALASELRHMARWLKLDQVEARRRGNLSAELRRALART
ncbi:MAG: YcaQ family DNA glycosylase [Rhizobiales bacterium]|nr:YcaQ family DNA glycosylase [Hyphomicrobiales bacterium]